MQYKLRQLGFLYFEFCLGRSFQFWGVLGSYEEFIGFYRQLLLVVLGKQNSSFIFSFVLFLVLGFNYFWKRFVFEKNKDFSIWIVLQFLGYGVGKVGLSLDKRQEVVFILFLVIFYRKVLFRVISFGQRERYGLRSLRNFNGLKFLDFRVKILGYRRFRKRILLIFFRISYIFIQQFIFVGLIIILFFVLECVVIQFGNKVM